MNEWEAPGKYLGLPAEWGRSKSNTLNWLKLRVLEKIDGWKEKLLNQAGKEVLIKAVIQAIPSYAMSIVRFPKGFCKSLCSSIARFWWRNTGRERGIHWKDWSSISKAKSRGGLGFKDFSLMNLALLAKQAWRAYNNPESLWVKVLKGLYFPRTDLMKATKGRGTSWGWQSLVQGKDFLRKAGLWLIGGGNTVEVWNDNWLSTSPLQIPENAQPDLLVSALFQPQQQQWDTQKLLSTLPREAALKALQIPLGFEPEEDLLCWPYYKDGNYTVKTGYQVAVSLNSLEPSTSNPSHPNEEEPIWKLIWSLYVPQKIKMFLWKACNGALPVKAALFRRHITPDATCPHCNSATEDIPHALLGCEWTGEVWHHSQLQFDSSQAAAMPLKDWILFMDSLLSNQNETHHENLAIMAHYLWGIWKERNDCHFQGRATQPLATAVKIKARLVPIDDPTVQSRAAALSTKRIYSAPWTLPPPGTLKLNTDATFFLVNNRGSIAVICKDEKGATVLSHSRPILAPNPFVAEAIAMREALLLAMNLEFPKIYVFSDNLKLVSLIRERKREWIVDPLLRDIQRLRSTFRTCGFFWTPRQNNQQAHSHARHAFYQGTGAGLRQS